MNLMNGWIFYKKINALWNLKGKKIIKLLGNVFKKVKNLRNLSKTSNKEQKKKEKKQINLSEEKG